MSSSSSSSFSGAGARVPFRFPLHLPASARPISYPDWLTRELSKESRERYVGGAVKILAGLLAAQLGATLWWSLRRANRLNAAQQIESPKQTQQQAQQAEQSAASAAAAAAAPVLQDSEDDESSYESGLPRPTLASRKSMRQSMRPGAGASASAAAAEEEEVAPLPQAPFKLGLVSPRSLERYSLALRAGFEELAARESRDGSGGAPRVLREVELLLPSEGESAAAFASRVRAAQCDVLLVQYHAAAHEEPVAFQDFGRHTPRMLLLHRPEEALLRHERHVFKSGQFNVDTLLREAHVVCIMGESFRGAILKRLPQPDEANVCVVAHGFSALDEAAKSVRQPRGLSASKPTIVGAVSAWGEMRWLADLLQAQEALEAARARASSSGESFPQIALYAAGRFDAYVHPHSKDSIDELQRLMDACPERIVRVELESLPSDGSVDELKAAIWAASDSGRRIVVVDAPAALDSPLQREVCDFQLHAFREVLRDGAPKVEYSGALHSRPGAALPIVLDSPAMADLEIEGLTLVPTPLQAPPADAVALAPWYGVHACLAPAADFAPVWSKVLQYIAHPSHYESHRAQTLEAARHTSMRHIAHQYQHIVEQMFASDESDEQ